MKKIQLFSAYMVVIMLFINGCVKKPIAEFIIPAGMAAGVNITLTDASTFSTFLTFKNKQGNGFIVPNPGNRYAFLTLTIKEKEVRNLIYLEPGQYHIDLGKASIVKASTSATENELIYFENKKHATEGAINDSLEWANKKLDKEFPKNYKENVALIARLTAHKEASEFKLWEDFARKYPNSETTPLLLDLSGRAESFPRELKKIMALTSIKVRQGKIGAPLMKIINANEQLLAGSMITDIAGWDLDGKGYKNDVLKKLNLIICWSSYDTKIPDIHRKLSAIYDQYKKKGVEFIGVSFDTDRNELPHIMSNNPEIKWPQYTDLRGMGSTNAAFSNSKSPYLFLIDKDKKILEKDVDIINVAALLDKYLKKL